MQFGLYLRSFMTDRSRPLYQQIDEVVEICHVARDVGFSAISVPQHWVSYPTTWPHPIPLLGRLAPGQPRQGRDLTRRVTLTFAGFTERRQNV